MTAPSKKEMEKLKQSVQQKFEQIREALSLRERLLLRQIDVIATSTQKMTRAGAALTTTTTATTAAAATPVAEGDTKMPLQELRLLTDNEEQLLSAIRSYGRFNLDSINLALLQDSSYMSNEDYITPSNDHETMYKCLNTAQLVKAAATTTTNTTNVADEEDPADRHPSAIVVDFSRNKSLIEQNVSNMNESIINITLAEAKELIRKAKTKREREAVPPLNLEELADEQESSLAEAVSSLGRVGSGNHSGSVKSEHTLEPVKKSKKQRFKPKITINNCNGTINLRNISNLTINCANEESVRAELPLQQPEEGADAAKQSAADSSASATVEELCSSTSTGNSTPTATTTNTGGTTTTSSNSNYSSNASSRKQSQKHKQSGKRANNNETGVYVEDVDDDDDDDEVDDVDDDDVPATAKQCNDFADDDEEENAVHCEFYNRLLNEIKNSLKRKSTRYVDNAQYAVSSSTAVADSSNCDSNSNAENTSRKAPPPKRFVLKNFENLKIVLESNGAEAGSAEESFHPVQIEQWLAEIISETDLEPMQNTDILEHSRIHEKCKK